MNTLKRAVPGVVQAGPAAAISVEESSLHASAREAGVSRSRPRGATLSASSIRNLRMMHLLERIAGKFNELEIPLMVLKGAALNLTVYDGPEQRPMADLDLMVRVEDLEGACAALEGLGGLRSPTQFRDDFFPRFHYELEYNVGTVYPVKIDLHVRPFRPLRYSQLVPSTALWDRADTVRIGLATVLIPSVEDMLIHLTAHAAIHGPLRPMWLADIRLWIVVHQARLDWTRFLTTVEEWRLALPVRKALNDAEREFGPLCPPPVSDRLEEMRVNWRDRLALWQAPRDAGRSGSHVAVNVLCTPRRRFVVGYLLAVVFPDRAHMADWYCHRHWGWLACAHLLRWLGPVAARLPRVWSRVNKIAVRPSNIHGVGVFATRDIATGEVIARYSGRRVGRKGMYVVEQTDSSGNRQQYELTGKLRFLNHSCGPNAAFSQFELRAVRPITAGQEITITYGSGTCSCMQVDCGATNDAPARVSAQVA
jgi:hypothetical protein